MSHLFFLLVSLLFIALSHAQTLRIITTDNNGALVDSITGEVTCNISLPVPAVKPGCQWKFPAAGTRGQTSTVFNMNQTNFITGQQVCGDSIESTVVFQLWGPYCSPNFAPWIRMYPLYSIDPAIPLEAINVLWDHTCNVVVLQPQYFANGTLIMTKQVSEYDAQVRPQVDFEFDIKECDDCWRKVNGLGALDYGTHNSIWSPELNCGVSCLLYTLEEHLVKGVVKAPRAIIGRSFRTDILGFNITDSVQAQTLSWSPYKDLTANQKNQFLGIGICCTTEQWCHPGCKGLDSHMVLISFLPNQKDNELSILADIGDMVDMSTIRLGVEFSPQFTENMQAFVYYQDMIIIFDLVEQNGVIISATRLSQSPKINPNVELVAWAPGYPPQ